MPTYVHALEIDSEKCEGEMTCMRVCPTDAIRVRDGKVRIDSTLCIDCGQCIVACTNGAIRPLTDSWVAVHKFSHKVAIVSPTLYGQFPLAITPVEIVEGLMDIGFDAVYDMSVESELVIRAMQDYLDSYRGPLPLISSTCPAIVRLIQVSFPDMVGQVIPIEPPREIAGREMKEAFSTELGIPPEEIGAIYISPCPAKIVSIKQPAEGVESFLDLALGISDVYNILLAAIAKRQRADRNHDRQSPRPGIKGKLFLNFALTGGQSRALRQSHSISVVQLPNIVRVLEDVEKGKIRNVHFLECYACNAGCIGGPLTVDERFVARGKIHKLVQEFEAYEPDLTDEIERRYVPGDYFFRQPLKPRPAQPRPGGLKEQIRRVKTREEFARILPGIDCGLCGAPSCEAFAGDVANGEAKPTDCVLISNERLDVLRKTYPIDTSKLPVDPADSTSPS